MKKTCQDFLNIGFKVNHNFVKECIDEVIPL